MEKIHLRSKTLFSLIFITSCFLQVKAQSFVFGLKGGPVIATQNWSSFQREPLFDLHGIAFIETWAEDDPNALFAQLGYHTRGSSLRQLFINPSLGFIPQSRSFKFRNLVLTVGGKRKFQLTDKIDGFYSLGIRGEYNINTNLDEFRLQNQTAVTSYPLNEFVRKFTYGVYAGGGIEWEIAELIGVMAEVSVNPDLNRQYFQPPLTNVLDPVTGQIRNLSEREIRNITLEISFGIRLLRKVVYID